MDLLPKGVKRGDSKNGYLNKLMGGDPDRDTDREDEPTTQRLNTDIPLETEQAL